MYNVFYIGGFCAEKTNICPILQFSGIKQKPDNRCVIYHYRKMRQAGGELRIPNLSKKYFKYPKHILKQYIMLFLSYSTHI